MKPKHLVGFVCLAFLGCKTNAQTSNSNSRSEVKKSNEMKEFSLLVRVPVSYSTEQVKAASPKWDALIEKWKADSIYIISFPFPGEGYIVSGADKSTKKGTVISENLRVVSNLFIRAINIESAVDIAKACPILEYGGSVEVREIPQRPVKPTN